MILTPHILAGAAIGSKFNKPRTIVVLIFLALLSHYLLDIIPHFEYNLSALKTSPIFDLNFAIAIFKVTLDFLSGISLVIFLGLKKSDLFYMVFGGITATIPDALLFLSWGIPSLDFLKTFNRALHFLQTDSIILGLATQIIVVAMTIFIILLKQTKKQA